MKYVIKATHKTDPKRIFYYTDDPYFYHWVISKDHAMKYGTADGAIAEINWMTKQLDIWTYEPEIYND